MLPSEKDDRAGGWDTSCPAFTVRALPDGTGLARLHAPLDSQRYEADLPEECALLTVAWLMRAGDTMGALRLVDELEPFVGTLRFTPRRTDAPAPDACVVHRRTAGDVYATLAARRPNRQVEAQ